MQIRDITVYVKIRTGAFMFNTEVIQVKKIPDDTGRQQNFPVSLKS